MFLYTSTFSKISVPFHIPEAWKVTPFGYNLLVLAIIGSTPTPPATPHCPMLKIKKEIIVNLMLQAFLDHLEVKIILMLFLEFFERECYLLIHLWWHDFSKTACMNCWCKCWTWQRWLFFLKLKSNYSWWNAAKINNITCIATVSFMKWTAENF